MFYMYDLVVNFANLFNSNVNISNGMSVLELGHVLLDDHNKIIK